MPVSRSRSKRRPLPIGRAKLLASRNRRSYRTAKAIDAIVVHRQSLRSYRWRIVDIGYRGRVTTGVASTELAAQAQAIAIYRSGR